jgi:shikimate dehydrogenase
MQQYGLIGKSIQHSFSPSYFAKKFEREGISNAQYDLFPLAQIEDFPALVASKPNWGGLNVTIPYKEQVIPYLDELSAGAQAVGAVNTIAFEAGRLIGHNTDVLGFRESLLTLLPPNYQNLQALILGTGGAAKAVAYVLEQLNLSYRYVSRKEGVQRLLYAQITTKILEEYRLIINTSPVGQHPNIHEAPNLPYTALGAQHFLMDLIYNPAETLFLKRGRAQGAAVLNGLPMLEGQAEAAWSIWTGR